MLRRPKHSKIEDVVSKEGEEEEVCVMAMTLAILRFLMTLFSLIREISVLYLN